MSAGAERHSRRRVAVRCTITRTPCRWQPEVVWSQAAPCSWLPPLPHFLHRLRSLGRTGGAAGPGLGAWAPLEPVGPEAAQVVVPAGRPPAIPGPLRGLQPALLALLCGDAASQVLELQSARLPSGAAAHRCEGAGRRPCKRCLGLWPRGRDRPSCLGYLYHAWLSVSCQYIHAWAHAVRLQALRQAEAGPGNPLQQLAPHLSRLVPVVRAHNSMALVIINPPF